MEDNVMENAYFTLTDEDGNEIKFEVVGECEKDGQKYFAVIPVEEEGDEEACEYGILKLAVEGDEEFLVTIDDDKSLSHSSVYFVLFVSSSKTPTGF